MTYNERHAAAVDNFKMASIRECRACRWHWHNSDIALPPTNQFDDGRVGLSADRPLRRHTRQEWTRTHRISAGDALFQFFLSSAFSHFRESHFMTPSSGLN